MTIPATISITSAAVGLVAALLVLGMSSAPGWRELRWFSLCALLGALFNLSNVTVTLDVPEATRAALSRLSLFWGGLHICAWFVYTRAHAREPLSRFDRVFVSGGVVLSTLALVPGLLQTSATFERPVPWLGVVYRDVDYTPLGVVAVAYYCASLVLLLARQLRRWRRGDGDGVALLVALGAVLVGGVHDGLATTRVLPTPYLLDLSLLVLVLAVGGSLVSRFLASARTLDETVARLAATQEELVKRERLAALGELAAVVAHEVRNPLAVVFNALAGLRKGPAASPDHERLLAIAQEEAERLRDIVSELIDFARPRSLHFTAVDLGEAARGAATAACEACGVGADEAKVSVSSRVGAFDCDERLVRRALVNLVTNALQAEGRRGPVEVAVDETEGGAAIVVTDDGRGVDESVRERIFTPFFTTRATGTGLGLAVVQRCAEAHGGAVDVGAASEDGADTAEGTADGRRGARFTLRLARRAGAAPRPAT